MKIYLHVYVVLIAVNSMAQTPVPIRPKIIRELSGYAGDEGDISKPSGFFNWFGLVDPKNGVLTPSGSVDTIFGFPRHMYEQYYMNGTIYASSNYQQYYPGNRGIRVIFDFAGLKDMNDTTAKVSFTEFWAYNALFDAGDTLYLYNLDTIFRYTPAQRAKYLSRPDSLLTPFAKIVTTVNPGGLWVHVTQSQSCRYMMVRTVLKNRGVYNTFADFSEFSFYGLYGYDTTAVTLRPGTYTGALPTNNTYGQLVGTNEGNGYDTAQQVYDGNWRLYGSMAYWDSTRANTTTASATYAFDYFPDIGPAFYPFYKRTGRRFWWSIKGASNYLKTIVNTSLNIDTYGTEPESLNYTRDGKFFFNYAAKFGNVNVSSGLTHWFGDAGYTSNGLNMLYYVENGNEDNYTVSPLCYFMRSSQDYDSLKSADSNFKLIMSGTTELDTTLLETWSWCSQVLRADKKFPWDIVNFHHYPRKFVNELGYAPSTQQQVGVSGASPESDAGIGIYNLYTMGAKSLYNYLDGDTTKWFFNTEYGYSNWGTPSINETQAAYPWDMGNVPSRGSFDSIQYKAILQNRSEIIMCFTPVIGYNEFFFHNSDGSNVNQPNLFASDGRVALRNISPPFNATYFFNFWYYRVSTYKRMKWYRPLSIGNLSDTTNLFHVIFVKIDSTTNLPTDSLCDVIWKPTQTGATASSQTVKIGYRKNSLVEKYVPSLTTLNGTSTTVGVLLNNLPLATQDEQATFYFGKSGASLWVTPFKAIKAVN